MIEDLRDKVFSQASDAGVAKRTSAELSHIVRKTDEVLSVQSIAAGEGSEIRDNTQITNLHLADRDFYFFMVLKDLDGSQIIEDADIEAGKVYSVSLSVSLNPAEKTKLMQKPIKIKKQLDLSFMGNDFEILDNRIISFQVADYQTWREEFQIKVRQGSKGIGSLRLDFKEGQADFMPYASRLEVNVCSLVDSITPPKTVNLTANISCASNAAILYVIPNGEAEWLIQGVSPHESLNCSISAPSMPLDLWDFARNCIDDILNWLRGVKSYFNDRFNLAIVDRTSQQISWESIQLDSNEFLAENAKVVRWVEQKSWGKPILLDLELSRTYQGRLVPYEHPFGANCNDLHDRLNDWREALRKHDRQPVAIALLHCEQELTKHLNQVRFDDLEKCLQDRPLFLFVNSPRSAQLLWQDKRPFGIAAKALSQIASGYLGTMGEVEAKLAKAVNKKFIECASSDNGISPALFLQGLRANYKRYFTGNDLQKRQAEQIFSYVYYGNPDDVVKITGGGQS
ncbi:MULTISPECIES: hypothetical protein [Pseudanabaena]|uniref:hypothetical protein n=1 Tax=Pseudanabaena TaxID=1152 RepID=UPI002478A6E3|nr:MULTISPECIES: hypothetical protein [Pseudanabaena]MEA5489686.1 hypothetical protein [Pseudanabaena sp. CCNP1317]WGS73846.1 hypothetical protein OA858_07395 [Pseudanabaena galeata CCNP1313]